MPPLELFISSTLLSRFLGSGGSAGSGLHCDDAFQWLGRRPTMQKLPIRRTCPSHGFNGQRLIISRSERGRDGSRWSALEVAYSSPARTASFRGRFHVMEASKVKRLPVTVSGTMRMRWLFPTPCHGNNP